MAASRQTRVGKKAAVKAGRYAHAKQFKRMHRCLRKLRTYVGRMIRDIRRKTTDMDEELATLLDLADRIRIQRPKNMLFSLHEPDVQCISKAKPTSVTSPASRLACWAEGGGGHDESQPLDRSLGTDGGNPYDGHTLTETSTTVERVTGMAPTDAYVDKGYRGHGYTGVAAVHIAGQRKRTRRKPNESADGVAARSNRRLATSKAITGWVDSSWRGSAAMRSTPCWLRPGQLAKTTGVAPS